MPKRMIFSTETTAKVCPKCGWFEKDGEGVGRKTCPEDDCKGKIKSHPGIYVIERNKRGPGKFTDKKVEFRVKK